MEVREFLSKMRSKGGKIGGKIAAKKMTRAQRTARAKKAAAASVNVRSRNAREQRKAKGER
jgi:hypothetical protein